jgi:hypothetical protein
MDRKASDSIVTAIGIDIGKNTFHLVGLGIEPTAWHGASLVPSENLIRRIRSRKENRIMIETDGDLPQTSAWIYAGLLSFA